eukprot:PhM_4_TR13077/c0_g1_i1/m.75315
MTRCLCPDQQHLLVSGGGGGRPMPRYVFSEFSSALSLFPPNTLVENDNSTGLSIILESRQSNDEAFRKERKRCLENLKARRRREEQILGWNRRTPRGQQSEINNSNNNNVQRRLEFSSRLSSVVEQKTVPLLLTSSASPTATTTSLSSLSSSRDLFGIRSIQQKSEHLLYLDQRLSKRKEKRNWQSVRQTCSDVLSFMEDREDHSRDEF